MGGGASTDRGAQGYTPKSSIRRRSIAAYLKLAAVITVKLGKCTKEDMNDESVKATMKLIDGNPILSREHLDQHIRQASLDEKALEAQKQARRERLAKDAEIQIAKFNAMKEEDRISPLHEGVLENYTNENQAKREKLYEDDIEIAKLLDDWWTAATYFIDLDANQKISASEYVEFHKRLFKLVQSTTGGLELKDEEMKLMMQNDFNLDSGGDGSVDREEFRFAVFQLADQWTDSCDAEEYIEFLKRGYNIVFSDFIQQDQLQWPSLWSKELKQVRNINRMPLLRCVDIMTGILSSKFKADNIAKEHNKESIHLEEFVIDFFKTKHGNGAYLKQFKSFVLSVTDILEEENNPVYHFALLFAQMCGFHTKSGRIVAFPHKATCFLLQNLEGVLKIAKTTALMTKVVENSATRIGIDARSTMLVNGILDLKASTDYLNKVLTEELKISNKSPLHKVAMLSIAALSVEMEGVDGTPKRVVQTMRFSVLLGILYAAWDSTNMKSSDDSQIEEGKTLVTVAEGTTEDVKEKVEKLQNNEWTKRKSCVKAEI